MLARTALRALAVLCIGTLPLVAQTTASLTGTVTIGDLPAPGVSVTVTSPVLQGERTTLTGDNGAYRFPSLPPGEYLVRFALTGTQERVEKAHLHLAQTSRVDALMIPAAVETMTVHGAPPPELKTTAVATTLTLAEVERLPVQRNQNATA